VRWIWINILANKAFSSVFSQGAVPDHACFRIPINVISPRTALQNTLSGTTQRSWRGNIPQLIDCCYAGGEPTFDWDGGLWVRNHTGGHCGFFKSLSGQQANSHKEQTSFVNIHALLVSAVLSITVFGSGRWSLDWRWRRPGDGSYHLQDNRLHCLQYGTVSRRLVAVWSLVRICKVKLTTGLRTIQLPSMT